MSSKNYTDGLNFSWPTKNDTNWDVPADSALTAISGHGHTGTGDGDQIVSAALAADAVTGAKLRLANNEALRARNAAGSADVNLLKLTTGNLLSVLLPFLLSSTETLTGSNSSEAVSLSTLVTISNKSQSGSAALTLADGTEGQIKLVHNKNSGTIVCTPATTAGTNTASLVQRGTVLYIFLDSEWRAFAGAGCTLS
jgi:hypothetical protein